MKYFQLIFLVFCVGGAVAAVGEEDLLLRTYEAISQRTSTITYEDFQGKLKADLEGVSQGLARKKRNLLRPTISEDGDNFTVDSENILGVAGYAWENLKRSCSDENQQNLILSVALEFLEDFKKVPGSLSGETLFTNLKTYLTQSGEDIFWEPQGKSITALYYFMRQFSNPDRKDIPKTTVQRKMEHFGETVEFLRTSPKVFQTFFVKGSDGSLRSVAEKMVQRLGDCQADTGGNS